MSTTSTPKPQVGGSQTWGSGHSDAAKGSSLRRRRTKAISEKRIADDEFMAAAIGDVEWLKQSLRDAGSDINFDKNVSICGAGHTVKYILCYLTSMHKLI